MIGNIYIVGGSDWRMTDVATNATPEIFTNLNVGIGTDNPSLTGSWFMEIYIKLEHQVDADNKT